MFTIGGGTAQILRTQVASRTLGKRLPQTRDGHVKSKHRNAFGIPASATARPS